MNKKKQKKVTKRVIKKLLKEETNADILNALSGLAAKASAINQEDFEYPDISLIFKQECSQQEVDYFRRVLSMQSKKN